MKLRFLLISSTPYHLLCLLQNKSDHLFVNLFNIRNAEDIMSASTSNFKHKILHFSFHCLLPLSE